MEAALCVAGWSEFAPGWMLTTDAAASFRQLHYFTIFARQYVSFVTSRMMTMVTKMSR